MNSKRIASAPYVLRATIVTSTPDRTALLFSAVLAADKGFASTIARDGQARIVVASDGQAVRFEKGGAR